jgi:flagellar biosynthesis protein
MSHDDAPQSKPMKAVALAYEKTALAPRIVGQGEGYVAEAILAKAAELGIPTRVEPELVEFLMQLKLNELIPPQLYAAVAEVLAWAHQVDEKITDKNKYDL